MSRKQLSTTCPSCNLPMETVAMSCPSCELKIEGHFSESLIHKLSQEDQEFLVEYMMAGFSIKTLEQSNGLGYAAIRSRLDRLITNFTAIKTYEEKKAVIVEQLRSGIITVAQAKEELDSLNGDYHV